MDSWRKRSSIKTFIWGTSAKVFFLPKFAPFWPFFMYRLKIDVYRAKYFELVIIFLHYLKRLWFWWRQKGAEFRIPYARHYKPRFVYFFTPFPKTIYVLWPLALCMAYIQERPMMARILIQILSFINLKTAHLKLYKL